MVATDLHRFKMPASESSVAAPKEKGQSGCLNRSFADKEKGQKKD